MTNSLFWRTFAHSWPTVRRFVISSQMVFVMLSLRLIPYSLLCPLDEPLG